MANTSTIASNSIDPGGSVGGAVGPIAYDGYLYASSGYGLYFHMPGNVLIAFTPGDPDIAEQPAD